MGTYSKSAAGPSITPSQSYIQVMLLYPAKRFVYSAPGLPWFTELSAPLAKARPRFARIVQGSSACVLARVASPVSIESITSCLIMRTHCRRRVQGAKVQQRLNHWNADRYIACYIVLILQLYSHVKGVDRARRRITPIAGFSLLCLTASSSFFRSYHAHVVAEHLFKVSCAYSRVVIVRK